MKKEAGPIAKTVDEYIKALPKPTQTLLKEVRKAIKEAAPEAEEVISYQIPTYRQQGPLVHFAAFKDHCSFVVVSKTIHEKFKKELAKFEGSGRTIHFSTENPLPAALIKKIVKTRVEENLDNGIKKAKAKPAPKTATKSAKAKRDLAPAIRIPSDEVTQYMEKLKHPLKNEIEALRNILVNVNPEISERIKWNAPSYHFHEQDFVTFNHRDEKRVHLVFHHPLIEEIKSPLLEGDYKGRRMTYFSDMKAIKDGRKELEQVVKTLIRKIQGK